MDNFFSRNMHSLLFLVFGSGFIFGMTTVVVVKSKRDIEKENQYIVFNRDKQEELLKKIEKVVQVYSKHLYRKMDDIEREIKNNLNKRDEIN